MFQNMLRVSFTFTGGCLPGKTLRPGVLKQVDFAPYRTLGSEWNHFRLSLLASYTAQDSPHHSKIIQYQMLIVPTLRNSVLDNEGKYLNALKEGRCFC